MAIRRSNTLQEQTRTTGTTFSYSFNNTEGDYLVVALTGENGDTIPITYAGVSMTLIVSIATGISTTGIKMYALQNPTKGVNTVSASGMNSGGNFTRFHTAAYVGVSQESNVVDVINSVASTSATPGLTLASTVSRVWSVGMIYTNSASTATGTTVKVTNLSNNIGIIDTNNNPLVVGTAGFTLTQASALYSIAGFSLNEKPESKVSDFFRFFLFR